MANKMLPLGEKIIVKPDAAEEKTKTGIILPDASKEKSQEGKVVAVGSGRVLDSGARVAPEVKVGDKVLFQKYSGTEVKINNEDHIILSERDILAVKL
jgi:chaperonin GroES